jgi:hypothetical protein
MINVTDTGFPEEAPGLKPWQAAYEKEPNYKVAFATSVVLGADGRGAFGTSGCGHQGEWKVSINYHGDKFLAYLEGAAQRFQAARKIAADGSLDAEARDAKLQAIREKCAAQIKEAATCKLKGQK